MRNRTPRISRADRANVNSMALGFLPMFDNQDAILTFSTFGRDQVSTSTGVQTDAIGTVSIDRPHVILEAAAEWKRGNAVFVLSRSFDLGTVARLSTNGYPIPYKTIRTWLLTAGQKATPLTSAETRSGYLIDPETSMRIEPDISELYADAWPLTGNPSGQ
jgi:hypothetical protein